MRGPLTCFWIALCVMSQVLWCAVPPGATVCVRSLFSPIASEQAAAPSSGACIDEDSCGDCCCACETAAESCCGDDGSQPGEDDPAPGPCRERDCSLCVKSVLAIANAKSAWSFDDGHELAVWAISLPPALMLVPARDPQPCQRPPPLAPGGSSAGLVGTIIILV